MVQVQQVSNRIEKLETLAVYVNSPNAEPNRGFDVEIALLTRPDLYFNVGPEGEEGPDRIGMHGAHGDVLPAPGSPTMFVPQFTGSWDAAKKLMLENWTIDAFHEWFGMGCTITLTEGERGATGRWYHTERQIAIEQQGPRDVGVLLAAILLSYSYSLRHGKIG
jgi:hypothetical protein